MGVGVAGGMFFESRDILRGLDLPLSVRGGPCPQIDSLQLKTITTVCDADDILREYRPNIFAAFDLPWNGIETSRQDDYDVSSAS